MSSPEELVLFLSRMGMSKTPKIWFDLKVSTQKSSSLYILQVSFKKKKVWWLDDSPCDSKEQEWQALPYSIYKTGD